jgi:Holliday junction resolvasome RuvABC endonuclease subunit
MDRLRTLAVDPGRSTIGVAVFEGAALHYYAIKVLRVPGTPEDVRREASRVLHTLILNHRPTHMAIEQPLVVQQRAELLAHVISALKTTARRHGLAVSEYAPQAVRRFICASTHPTKREVARRLVARYPELSRYFSTRNRWAGLYYEKMFGAVAVGLVSYALHENQPAYGDIDAALC